MYTSVANRIIYCATDNFKVKKLAWKSAQNLRRMHKNGAQNFQVFFGAEPNVNCQK